MCASVPPKNRQGLVYIQTAHSLNLCGSAQSSSLSPHRVLVRVWVWGDGFDVVSTDLAYGIYLWGGGGVYIISIQHYVFLLAPPNRGASFRELTMNLPCEIEKAEGFEA